jgi:hypothetical protein
METVKIALGIMAGLIPILVVANYYLDRANRIL